MTELYANINGIKICYKIYGKGEPIILVHGFGSKKEVWIAQIPELSKKYKVITMDNRGAGKSDRPNQKYTMETFADDIAALIEDLKIEKVKAVIGWSLGGMIVQHFALKYPQLSEKFGLIFTNYKGAGGEIYKKMRLEQEELRKVNPDKAFWDGTRAGYLPKFRKEMEADTKKKFFGLWSVEDLMEMDIKDPSTAEDIESQAGALETHNTLDRLHEIKNSTLLLAASHDRLTPKITMEEMHKHVPNSVFKVIDNAGHSAPLSNAPQVNQILLEFLQE